MEAILQEIGRQTWGRWQLDRESQTLDLLVNETVRYSIRLRDMASCAGMLDMIFQFSGKVYFSNENEKKHSAYKEEDMLWLLRALTDLFHPQAHMCSFGTDRHFEKTFTRV